MEKKEKIELNILLQKFKDDLFANWEASTIPIQDFIQQELDKAREEGRREIIESINEAFQKKII